MAKPTEIRKFVEIMNSELVDKEGNRLDAEGYAKVFIDALDEMRTDTPTYQAVTAWPGKSNPVFGLGPYPTANKVKESLAKGHNPVAGLPGARTVIVKTYSPRHAARILEEIDK